MRVCLINLDRDIGRLKSADAQLKRLGIVYERVQAVDGRVLSQEKIENSVGRFRWWCAVGRPVTKGEIGCWMSHMSVYKKMLCEDISVACVMEDDAVLDDRLRMVLDAVEKRADATHAAVYLLSNHSEWKGQVGDRHFGFRSSPSVAEVSFVQTPSDFCAECYVLTKAAAVMLLKVNSPMITPCDWWGRWRRIGAIDLFHVFPTVAYQGKEMYASNTALGMVSNQRSWTLTKYLLHKFIRCVGVLIDRLLTLLTRR